jgi:hypothetical protein
MSLSDLACGVSPPGTSHGQVLAHLSTTIRALDTALLQTVQSPQERNLTLVGPYLTRALLESTFTALTARLDPFRVLIISAFQQEDSFDATSLSKCAFRWQGDVMDPTQKRDDGKIGDYEPSRYSRALLGDPWDKLTWRQAHQKLIDSSAPPTESEWYSELLATQPESLIPKTRTTAARLYTLFSKGVHSEFVIPVSAYYDLSTIIDAIDDTYKLLAQLGLLLNFVDHIPHALEPDDAIARFVQVERRLKDVT